MAIAPGWDAGAHAQWQSGRLEEAVGAVMAHLDLPAKASPALAMQATYYLFLAGEYGSARRIVEAAHQRFPDDLDLIQNLGVLCTRTGDPAGARTAFERYLDLGGTLPNAFDGLAAACHLLGDDEAARDYGRRAIAAKSRPGPASQRLSLGKAKNEGKDVISFSVWGDNPRYLRGALHNVLRAPVVYPGFACRFYVDDSVPADLLDALEQQGCELIHEPGQPTNRDRLTRRFKVANDPDVRRFLVRDSDSLLGDREAAAVSEWIASGLPFHAMRDWWTHTDPILAGMWGGMSGALPDLNPLIADYKSGMAETPNWDQWFLRDRIWPWIMDRCLVHDRLFSTEGSRPFPTPDPPGNLHVGQDEYAVRREQQASELGAFAVSVRSLHL